MDDSKRKELIIDIVFYEDFDSDYSLKNQLWFVEKVVRRFEAQGLSDEKVKEQTSQLVQKATQVVKVNRDFSLGLAANGNTRFTKRLLRNMRKQRVEILYGAIAFNPEFVEPAHLKYLLFIAKRRFRSICRMYIWVNPNSQGYFRYPHRCLGNNEWRVNEDAAPFWARLNPATYTPIKLKDATIDPVVALNKLFIKKTDACKGNLLDCSTVASIIFMDNLLEAKNPGALLQKMHSKGDGYLVIHQLGRAGNDTFERDATDEGMIRRTGLPTSDLQVGDHVYIYNHPLYKTFRPTGSWRGEHSLVYISGNRDYKSKDGFVFGGHGKNGTLYQFYDAFLSELKSHLGIARHLMVAHLAYLRGGAAAILPGTVVEEEHDVVIADAVATAYRLLEYDKKVEAKDFSKVPTKTKRKPRRSAPAFVIVQSKTEDVFYLDQIAKPDEDKPLEKNLCKTIAEITATGKLNFPIKFRRITPSPGGATPDEIYDLASWGVAYLDLSTATEKFWSFFKRENGKLKRTELTHDDLFQSPFALFTKAGTDLRVTQPKVDFGAAHQTFLASNGAF